MLEFGRIAVELTDRVAHAKLAWPQTSRSGDAPVLADRERLVDWIEDHKACDTLILSRAPAAADAGAERIPEIEECRRWEKLHIRIDSLACVSIAAIDGTCAAGWMQLALACDHRVTTAPSAFKCRK